MITKIIATADLHIRNLKRLDETKEQFEKFLKDVKKIVKKKTPYSLNLKVNP